MCVCVCVCVCVYVCVANTHRAVNVEVVEHVSSDLPLLLSDLSSRAQRVLCDTHTHTHTAEHMADDAMVRGAALSATKARLNAVCHAGTFAGY